MGIEIRGQRPSSTAKRVRSLGRTLARACGYSMKEYARDQTKNPLAPHYAECRTWLLNKGNRLGTVPNS